MSQEQPQKTSFVDYFWQLYQKIIELRIVRAFFRFGNGRGWLLAGGITYSAMFSIAAGLTIGINVLAIVMGSNPSLRLAIYKSIDSVLPGIITLPHKKGMVDPDSLVMNSDFSITGIIAIIILIYSSMSIMMALKSSIRAMFGIEQVPDNVLVDKLRDLLGFIAFGTGIVVTGILGLVNSRVGGAILDWLGLQSRFSHFLISTGTLAINALIDALIMYILIKFVSRVNVPRKDLLLGLGIFAVLSAILRYLGTAVVSASNNPILASFAALITLLLWINLLSRVILLVSAFIANPPSPKPIEKAKQVHADETPNYITLTCPHTLDWPQHLLTGTVDMLTLAEMEREEKRRQNTHASYKRSRVNRFLTWRIRHHQRKIDFLSDLRRNNK